jgi:hypothetical protein
MNFKFYNPDSPLVVGDVNDCDAVWKLESQVMSKYGKKLIQHVF